ncbi:MAG: TonB-dependent receptor [Gammaproteobacteria bacterium]|nr:TonB-dependent receptor [Gammaproteobacteria bacterium]
MEFDEETILVEDHHGKTTRLQNGATERRPGSPRKTGNKLSGRHPVKTPDRPGNGAPSFRPSALFLALVAAGFCAGAPGYVHAQQNGATDDQTQGSSQPVTTKGKNEKKKSSEAAAKSKKSKVVQLQSIEVHGFRQSIQQSISLKRYSSDIIEAVTAEDIGRLPGTSIAETLARMPGVTAQRVNGRAQSISIRGLGPDFSQTLFNGREQVSTGDNRSVEFDQYPSDLINTVVVYKTQDPGLVGAGLAGTVDLRTIRPLEYGHRTFSLGARYEFSGRSALAPTGINKGYRANGIYVDQFDDNRLGVTLGFQAQRTPSQIQAFNSWGHATTADGVIVPGGAKPFAETDELKRTAGLATFEFKPNANFHTTLDLTYSHFNDKLNKVGYDFPLGFAGIPVTVGEVQNGLAVSGVFNDVKAVQRNDLSRRFAQLYTAGLNQQIKFGRRWGAEADISYSRANRQDFDLESYTGTGPAGQGATDTLGFRLKPDGAVVFSPTLNYGDTSQFVLTDPQGWGAGSGVTQAGFINEPRTVDRLTHLKFDVHRDMDDVPVLSRVTVGTDLSRRDKSRTFFNEFLTLPGGATSAPIPQQFLRGTSADNSFFGIPQRLVYNPLDLLNNGVYVPVQATFSGDVQNSWQLREDVVTSFVKFDVNTRLGSHPLTGNLGTQVIYTNQGSSSPGVVGGDFKTPQKELVRDGAKYTRALPTLNLALGFPAINTQLRLGVGQEMQRARPDQLNASLSLNKNFTRIGDPDPNQSFFSASGGNPRLKPVLAHAVDLSLEKYLGTNNAGYVALAMFWKHSSDFVDPSCSVLTDFSQFLGVLTPAERAQLGTTKGITSAPCNDGDGDIKGTEFTFSIPTSLFTSIPVLRGFGFISSADYVFSRVQFGKDTEQVSLPGLSKWVVNSTLYFEQSGFEARISHRYRSSFLAEIFGLSDTRVQRTAKATSIFDAQISYSFSQLGQKLSSYGYGGVHSSLGGLTVFVQATNLTDEPFITFENKDPRQLIDEQKFGREFLAGFTYRF